MMRFLVALLLVLSCVSCANHSDVPDDVIPKAKMEKVLWDMLLADRYAAEYIAKPTDSLYKKTEVLKVYQKVFNVHGITRDEFLKSYRFYLGRPDMAKAMFDSIAPRAERMRSEVYRQRSTADSLGRKFRLDSLRKTRVDSLRIRLQKK